MLKKAKALQEEALRIFQSLAKDHPDVPEFVYDVGRCHMALGATEDRAGRLVEAIAHFDRSIEILKSTWDKGLPSAREMLPSARSERAIVWARQGDHSRAVNEAGALIRLGNLSSVTIYNVACIYSQSSMIVERDSCKAE
jgi:tetratricopeptide (TPR) repeat protein